MNYLTRNLIFFFLLSGFSYTVLAQSNMNYVRTYHVQISGIIDSAALNSSTPISSALQSIQYFDGLGRPVQTIQKGITPEGYDLIKPLKYNDVGLDEINYEPYADKITSSLNFRADFETQQPGFYHDLFGDNKGRSPIDYEKSPLNRVLKQGAPGEPWQISAPGHPIQFEYLANNSSNPQLKVICWNVVDNACKNNGDYGDNQLYATKTINEDGAVVYEFKDKQGEVVLKRSVLDDATNADTYYVYDDFGLLRFVISPEGTARLVGTFTESFTSIDDLAMKYVYCYTYDERKRLIEKQIPGKETEYYVYDKTDKVVLYQDGNMRNDQNPDKDQWMFTKYDAAGRVIMTGIINIDNTQKRNDLQNEANLPEYKCWEYVYVAGSATLPADKNYYSNQSFPSFVDYIPTYLTINYYDSYKIQLQYRPDPVSLCSNTELDFSMPQVSYPVYQPDLLHVAGKPTVSYVSCNSAMLATTYYYDNYGRTIQTAAEHHLRGYDRSTNRYKGLTANIENLFHLHYSYKKPDNTYTNTRSEEFMYSYDPAGRLTSFEYIYNGTPIHQIITNTYTTLGQLAGKQIGEDNYFFQNIDYQYNIRGWLTKINNPATMQSDGDLFSQELIYNTPNADLQNFPSFNGNISAAIWQTAQPSDITAPVTTGIKSYIYLYDKLNRLLYGKYAEMSGKEWDINDKYSEYIHTGSQETGYRPYDLNGNILSLYRYGLRSPNNSPRTIDQLAYTYKGNQLIAVDDGVTTNNGGDFTDNGHYYYGINNEYTYDNNGNLITDANKGIIEIKYNYQNQPISITRSGGLRLEYLYDGAGVKRQQRYFTNIEGNVTKTTDFVGNFVYENGLPAYNIYDEGRIVYNTDGTYFAEAFLKDHLGNVRVACRMLHGQLKVRQVDSYYPFGMNIKGLTANSTDATRPNEYLYNGKQMQDEMGLNWLDYGARFYDGVLGRFHTPDRYAEKYLSLTNYQYGANNPIRFIDINGDSVVYKNPSTEQYVKQFTSKTVTNKKGKEVENKQYSELFAKTIEKLDASSTVYEFSDSYSSSDKSEEGAVTTDGKKVFVAFGEPDEGYGSRSNLLFEETYHALQVETGSMKIEKNSTGTGYGFSGDALNAEYGAKSLSTSAPGSSLSYKNANGLKIETQIGLIKRLDPQEGKRYLTDGYSKIYPGDNNATYSTDYLAPYPHLKK